MSKPTLAEMITALQKLRQEMGRLPSRPEFHAKTGWTIEHLLDANQGSGYHKLVELSGLKYAAKGKRDKQEIRKQVFEKLQKDVEERRKAPEPPPLIRNILFISDLHKPYGHPDANEFIIAVADKYGIKDCLVGGDEVDGHGLSFHEKDPDLLSPGYELEAAIKALEPLYARFPNAYVLSSNHGDLLYRKGKHHGMPRAMLRDYGEILRSPKGWVWRESWTLQMSNAQKLHAAHGIGKNYLAVGQQLGMNFVQFHFHNELGLRYWTVNGETYFAIQSACMVDDTSRAMAYNKLTLGRPVMGISGLIDGLPRLFPMILDRLGRWTRVVP